MIGLFTAASIQSAFVNISEDLGVSMQRTSYLVSLFIAVLGGAPLFWRPLCNRFGRRPIFLISLSCALVGNIGCANSHSYGTMGLCRAITAFFISPAAAMGSAVVAETFFKKDRARCMGYWTLMVTIGVPVAPFLFGFMVMRVGYRWIYYVLAIVSTRYRSSFYILPTKKDLALIITLYFRSTASNSFCTSSSARNPSTCATRTPPAKSPASRIASSSSAASTHLLFVCGTSFSP